MSTSIIIFLLPCLFLFHELEEILMIPSWIKKNNTEMYTRFPKFKSLIWKMEQITRRKITIIAIEEFLIVFTCTIISEQTGNLAAWYCCLIAFGIHLILHFIQFLLWKRYIPAIVTSSLCLPFCIVAFLSTYEFFTSYEQVVYALIGILSGGLNLFIMHMIVNRIRD